MVFDITTLIASSQSSNITNKNANLNHVMKAVYGKTVHASRGGRPCIQFISLIIRDTRKIMDVHDALRGGQTAHSFMCIIAFPDVA